MLVFKTFPLFILLSLLITNDVYCQSRRDKKDKISKSTLIDLQIESDFYYKSFFQKFDGEELTLQSLIPELDGRLNLHENVVVLDDFDYIRIINKKKTFRNTIISGLIVGTASFFIVKNVSKNKDPKNLMPINQTGSNGSIEGALAGGLGFGIGIIVYDSMFNRRMSITNDRAEIVKKLKSIKL